MTLHWRWRLLATGVAAALELAGLPGPSSAPEEDSTQTYYNSYTYYNLQSLVTKPNFKKIFLKF